MVITMTQEQNIPTSIEQIQQELNQITAQVKENLQHAKRVAISEAWKILQLVVAATVQIIETIGTDLSSKEKKELAMNLLSNFYDKVFLIVDIPFIPQILESFLHKHVKNLLMILVSATIDSMVKIFKEIGVFRPRVQYQGIFKI